MQNTKTYVQCVLTFNNLKVNLDDTTGQAMFQGDFLGKQKICI